VTPTRLGGDPYLIGNGADAHLAPSSAQVPLLGKRGNRRLGVDICQQLDKPKVLRFLRRDVWSDAAALEPPIWRC